jgi:hypothetical protein
MPLLNKIGGALKRMGQYYTSPEGLQTVQAMLMDYANPGSGAYAALLNRRQDDAQREQYGTALSDLMAQMRGPDTMTPQVNELIGGANMRGGQVGMAPMPMQTPRRAGLDYSDPATREAFQRFIMAGGKPEFAQGIAESMQPAKPATWTLSRGQRVVDEAGNVIAEGPEYEERPLVVPQGGSVFWPGQRAPGYVAPKTFAPPRPAPTAAIGGTFGGNTRTINGKTYYRVNGAWYDNPEGR